MHHCIKSLYIWRKCMEEILSWKKSWESLKWRTRAYWWYYCWLYVIITLAFNSKANNSLLKVQLQESWFRQEDTENEAIRLRSNVGKMRMENEKLIQSVKQLEEKLNRKPAPPPPPPHPPKSLFLNLKNPFLKKQKQFRSVPENIHESHSKQGTESHTISYCSYMCIL